MTDGFVYSVNSNDKMGKNALNNENIEILSAVFYSYEFLVLLLILLLIFGQ